MHTTHSVARHSGDHVVPEIFCWTKMGSEAGQPLEKILRRKELERAAGNGIFAWGIGNSLGESPIFAKKATSDGQIDVLFSPMKSQPKAIDTEPSQLLLWLGYISEGMTHAELPGHILITSRGNLASGLSKKAHYALICEKQEEISPENGSLTIDAGCARNFQSMNRLGASQVTAMVRYQPDTSELPASPYPVAFRAKFHKEGFVRLASPVPLSGALLAEYRVISEARSPEEWAERVLALKHRARVAAAAERSQFGLF